MSNRGKCCEYTPINPENVPQYIPKCCPTPVNTNPRRFEQYCAPVVSRSEPLSHAEYLRKKREAGNNPISTPAGLVQIGDGKNTRTLWMESGNISACCGSKDIIPAVHSGALSERFREESHGAVASRGTIGRDYRGDRGDGVTTLGRKGKALVADTCIESKDCSR